MIGTVKRWYDDRGFGFIRPDGNGTDVFVHVKDLRASGIFEDLVEGERVSYELEPDRMGRPRAVRLARA